MPWVTLLLLLAAQSAFADTFASIVIGVSDGATLVVVDTQGNRHDVRIAGIDAPALGQPFGAESRQDLVRMANAKEVRLDCRNSGRSVCKVWVQPADCPTCGRTLDVGLAQIIAGLARWNRADAGRQSDDDRGRYESNEQEARLRGRGLWRATSGK